MPSCHLIQHLGHLALLYGHLALLLGLHLLLLLQYEAGHLLPLKLGLVFEVCHLLLQILNDLRIAAPLHARLFELSCSRDFVRHLGRIRHLRCVRHRCGLALASLRRHPLHIRRHPLHIPRLLHARRLPARVPYASLNVTSWPL